MLMILLKIIERQNYKNSSYILNGSEIFVNRKERKVGAKNPKLMFCIYALCDLRDPDSYRDFAPFAVNGFRLFRHFIL